MSFVTKTKKVVREEQVSSEWAVCDVCGREHDEPVPPHEEWRTASRHPAGWTLVHAFTAPADAVYSLGPENFAMICPGCAPKGAPARHIVSLMQRFP